MYNLNIIPETYQTMVPYPFIILEDFLEKNFALKIQQEILNINIDEWDRYDNPFEKKYTLRNKNKLPENTQTLFDILTTTNFLQKLSYIVGEELTNDPTKNWWGIHKYDNGDKLDIHSDAGIHPENGDKKHVTLGIYLSLNWNDNNGGHLELWDGDSVTNDNAKLTKQIIKILPSFNKMILFNNTNNAWHGNPYPVNCGENSKRIFLTLSYLSKNHKKPYDNYRKKAFFIKHPNEEENKQKDAIRLLRADENKCKTIYKFKL